MKLLIDVPLSWKLDFDAHAHAEENFLQQEHYQSLVAVARRASLGGKYTVDNKGVAFIIHAQKVTLDEADMNELFSDFFSELFTFKLEYAAIGGKGCRFTMSMSDAVQI